MESFINSSSTLTDFEFKYIPKKEFEKMVMRVERDRKLRESGVWGNFCSVTSAKDDDDDEELAEDYVTKREDVKLLADCDIESVIQSIDKKEINRRIPSTPAPFLGPARRLNVERLQQQHKRFESLYKEDSSETSSVHIVEEVNIVQQASDEKIQVPNQADDVEGDDEASERSSIDEKESLEEKLLKLCDEIENANGTKSSDYESSVDLTCQEKKFQRNTSVKTEEKIISEKYSKFIDKKFDFLSTECKKTDEDGATKAQTLPVVEPRQKPDKSKMKLASDDDFTNDNNVWIPKTENQIRKSGRKQEREKSGVKKKTNDEVFPSDVIIRKAREVGKLNRDCNEKSQAGATASSIRREGKKCEVSGDSVDDASSRAEVAVVLGKISIYQSKICQYLDNLREIIEEPPELEDKSDLKRRQMRSTEFSNRFARNCLYQIGRTAEEIRLMPDNPIDLATKVNFLFHIIMQAVQTYLKNVEMIIYNNCPDKLLVLVDFIINAMKVCFDRMVFDKRDLLIQQMMRKCLDMKQYLQMNQQSFARFASMEEKRRSSLFSRSSFAFETPYATKLSMYDSGTKPKPPTSRGKQSWTPSGSPYDAPKIRNLQSPHSHANATCRPKCVQSRMTSRTNSRVNSPKARRTLSNVSTAIQKINDEPKVVVAEKPLEGLSHAIQKSREMELMEMMHSIAKDQISDMLLPILSQLIPKMQEQQSSFEIPKTLTLKELPSTSLDEAKANPPPRVTSDVENLPKTNKETIQQKSFLQPEMPQKIERVERISKNIQYLYVKSDENDMKEENSATELNQPAAQPSQAKPRTKVVAANIKPPDPVQLKSDEKFTKKMKERALKERLNYVGQMMDNPLYVNELHSEPWKMFSQISDHILDDMLKEVTGELDFGEKSFVAKFLQHELGC